MRPLSLALATLAMAVSTEACLRLNVLWEIKNEHTKGELWEDGEQVCKMNRSTKFLPGLPTSGYDMDCIWGYEAKIPKRFLQLEYKPISRWTHGSLVYNTIWDVAPNPLEPFPDEITVWLSQNCTTCVGLDCKLAAGVYLLESDIDDFR